MDLIQSPFLINSVIASIIVISGFIAGHFISKGISLLLNKLKIEKSPRAEKYIESGIKYFIYIFAFMAALNRLGLVKTFLNILEIFFALLLFIATVLYLQDFFRNFFAGTKIKRKFKRGAKLKIDSMEGVLEKISLRDVQLRIRQSEFLIIPHTYFLKIYQRKD